MITTSLSIQAFLMLAVFGLPLVMGTGLSIKRWQPAIIRLAAWSALPALAAVIWVPSGEIVSIRWILLNMHLAMDPTGRLFLLFTSLLWLLSAIYAQSYLALDPRRERFFFFFLLSMAGNFGLIVSQDVISFYVFFALMSFASYGLVVHNGDTDALQAGRIYLYLVVIGEVLLISAFLLQAWTVDSLLLKDFSNVRPRAITIALVLIGFGIKAGALPVHVWLPLAHPAAPTPASAVLSGAMIKAGLLGWLRFLPIGLWALPGWGTLCIIAGLLAAYYAVAVGLTQRNPKTILAYSSISQMGLMTVGVGLAIGWPQAAPVVLPAIGIYAVHHGFAKGALFLGVGVLTAGEANRRADRLAVGGLIWASLALAGAPFTSGAIAKIALKWPLNDFQGPWIAGLNLLLPLAAIGTTLLMARFLFVITRHPFAHDRPRVLMWLSWTFTILLTATVVWFLPVAQKAVSKTLQLPLLWQALWPVAAGILVSGSVWLKVIRKKWRSTLSIPQGDLLYGFSALFRLFLHFCSMPSKRIQQSMSAILKGLPNRRPGLQAIRKLVLRIENRLTDWQTAGLIFVILIACLFAWSLRL
ncbi:MAG: proton-conducting transporter membrane subunit [Desulfobacterales bacterium]|jgi:formate hydrogenlyase subunit 3/multisubunit Na+/H+ antiporter MnhD subunit